MKRAAETNWSQRQAAILERKLAFKNNEWSYEGILYASENAKKGPCSAAERQMLRKDHDELVSLSRQLADTEREASEQQFVDEEDDNELIQDDIEYRLRFVEVPIDVYGVAMMSYHGNECEQDYVEAAYLCRIAAERGLAMVQHALALMYENGDGVPKDATEAIKWYRKASEQGFANSLNNLGACYEDGKGVKQDHAKAVECYLQAAEKGLSTAQSYIAGFFKEFNGWIPG